MTGSRIHEKNYKRVWKLQTGFGLLGRRVRTLKVVAACILIFKSENKHSVWTRMTWASNSHKFVAGLYVPTMTQNGIRCNSGLCITGRQAFGRSGDEELVTEGFFFCLQAIACGEWSHKYALVLEFSNLDLSCWALSVIRGCHRPRCP